MLLLFVLLFLCNIFLFRSFEQTCFYPGIVDYREDTRSLNRILAYSRRRGAGIVDVKVSTGMRKGSVKAGVVYLTV